MIKDLEKLLQVPVVFLAEADKIGLPIYLTLRPIRFVSIGGVEIVLIELPPDETIDVRKLVKQKCIYEEHFRLNAAFVLHSITSRQRNALIEHGVPFIALPEQIYLPFLGMMLQNKYRNPIHNKVEVFTPTDQMLFLLLAYSSKESRISKSEAAERLGVTNTSITRASAHLKSAGLLEEDIQRSTTMIGKTAQGAEYFELGKPYLIDPIQQVVYVKPNLRVESFPEAGETALAGYSMLNPPDIVSRACRKNKESKEDLVVDPLLESKPDYIRLELWRYRPEIFAKNGKVDPISLYCSLKEDHDERIEGELENMMEEIKWA